MTTEPNTVAAQAILWDIVDFPPDEGMSLFRACITDKGRYEIFRVKGRRKKARVEFDTVDAAGLREALQPGRSEIAIRTLDAPIDRAWTEHFSKARAQSSDDPALLEAVWNCDTGVARVLWGLQPDYVLNADGDVILELQWTP